MLKILYGPSSLSYVYANLTSYCLLRERQNSKCNYWINSRMVIGSGEVVSSSHYGYIEKLLDSITHIFQEIMVRRLVVEILLRLFWCLKRGVWRYYEFLLLCGHTLFGYC